MIHIIYLAAGMSRRYGANKLLTLYKGKLLYRHGLDALTAAADRRGDCTVYLVTCWDEIAAGCKNDSIRAVPCPDSKLGVSHSIRAGIAAAGRLEYGDYLMFAVADQPNLTADSILRLLDTVREKPITACLSCRDEAGETVRGNPVLFAASLADELSALEGDRGGKSVMRRHIERDPRGHIDVFCCPGELEDIDTP